MKKCRDVLFLAPTYPYAVNGNPYPLGGQEFSEMELTKALVELGVRVRVISIYGSRIPENAAGPKKIKTPKNTTIFFTIPSKREYRSLKKSQSKTAIFL